MMRLLVIVFMFFSLGLQAETLSIGSRDVIVYTPKSLGNTPAPLVMALHGGLGNARQFRFSLSLNAQADRYGFRVVYPQGTRVNLAWAPNGRVWNAGSCCGTAMRQNVDDVAFLKNVVRALERQGLVSKATAVGHSNGAMMALRVACGAPDVFDRVVAIAGPLLLKSCKRQKDLSVVHLHGTRDRNVPISGGVGPEGVSQFNFPPLQQSVEVLGAAGAVVTIETLTATHFLGSINRALRTARSVSLPEYVAQKLTQ